MAHTLEQLRSGAVAGAQRLDLAEGLTEFPQEIFELADTLEVLNLTGNALSSLPAELPRLHKLRVLFASENAFTELPAVLGQCRSLTMVGFKANRIEHVPEAALSPSLQWLILTDNRLTELPRSVGACSGMRKLMLSGNQLSTLPVELSQCSELEMLRLAANRFEQLPAWLPAMPQLAWLALAGNPLCQPLAPAADVPVVPWSAVELHELLGCGASGDIFRCTVQGREAAVKLFRSSMTSDGLPAEELAASLAAGLHPHLIPLQGHVVDHPSGQPALLMDLVPKSYHVLAGPPSLATCTRDVYPADRRLEPQAALRLLSGIASAAAHLHGKGITHGDLYAHNIHYREDGHAMLGDLGAAAGCPLEATEMLAFGHLLGEVMKLCPSTQAKLEPWHQACTRRDPKQRPCFDQVAEALVLLLRSAEVC
jgi:hypothetical protein